MKRLVIVESPAKAKTINRYLGKDYQVLASYGHIRDLPSKSGSVKPEENFAMTWQVSDKSEKYIKDIVKAAKNANEILLATDPDREGEAIAWHIKQVLHERGLLDDRGLKRIVFNEITKAAIANAVDNPRTIDDDLVEAYLARRALDYLVGFSISPILWRKLPGSRSAGRVQSVALRLIVDREAEIEAFKPQEYWSVINDMLSEQNKPFKARLTHVNGKKLEKLSLENEVMAKQAVEAIKSSKFTITKIDKKTQKRNPAAPFITSTLQQEASRKLRFSASRTMQTAQKLYEGIDIGGEVVGLITYMRTDGTNLASEAVKSIRELVNQKYGKEYLPASPRAFSKKVKNAQEAHEAIRPTDITRHPKDVAAYLSDEQRKLYELIWLRTVACQMAVAEFDKMAVDINSADNQTTLRANGSALKFDGFLRVYKEGRDDSVDEDEDNILPPLNVGETATVKKVDPQQHFTQPPPRFSEASLVKKLEELGIGRPSTYASIIHVLQDRNYVRIEKRQFIPEDRGRLVTTFLCNFFNKYVEYDFTAGMEEKLDDVSSGKKAWLSVVDDFWVPFNHTVSETEKLRLTEVLDKLQSDLETFLFPGDDPNKRQCPTCKDGLLSLKLGKFGAFLGCSNYPECNFTKQLGITDDNEAEAADQSAFPRELGADGPATVTVRKGPYGFYIQWDDPTITDKKAKPKRVSIPSMFTPMDITLEDALKLKKLPYEIGSHPETGSTLTVGVGRFGPYIKLDNKFTSIPKNIDFLSLTLDEALQIIADKAKKKSSKTATKTTKKKTATASKGRAKKTKTS